jgi:hypothetical protein
MLIDGVESPVARQCVIGGAELSQGPTGGAPIRSSAARPVNADLDQRFLHRLLLDAVCLLAVENGKGRPGRSCRVGIRAAPLIGLV